MLRKETEMEKMSDRFERIDSVISNGVYLYGAGMRGIWIHDYLQKLEINCLAFIDSNPGKQGTVIDGLPCISYREYRLRSENDVRRPVLITAINVFREIFETYSDDPYIMPFDTWFTMKHEKEYKALVFDDEKSYRTLAALLRYKQTGCFDVLWDEAEQNQYFSVAPFWGNVREIFVDLGACTGDSTERFIQNVSGQFRHIYAFEPGTLQHAALNRRMDRCADEWLLDRSSIVTEKYIVSERSGIAYFDESGEAVVNHVAESGSKMIAVTSLDDYFGEKDVTFIKSDIEGSEYGMLLGSEKLIRRCRPKLAISVYHKPDDILRIYGLIAGWELGYKFRLRHHSTICAETVLYCYI